MTLTEEIFARTRVMVPALPGEHHPVLEAVCRSAAGFLRGRLRDAMTPESCKEDFVTAASLLALAALTEAGYLEELEGVERITVGDMTLQRGKNSSAAQCLRQRAMELMSQYLRSGFTFQGV